MLGKRSAQRGLFEADTQYGDFVGRQTFYGWLANQRGDLFRDEDFGGLYVLNNGRPSVPPSLLATALVLQTYDGVSDDEAKRRADYDLQWKVALGVALDQRPFAKSTLQEFRAQLVVHQEQRAIFQRSLEVAKRRGKFRAASGEARRLKLVQDTSNILGRGAVKDTYNLLADGIKLLARVLARLAGEPLERWAERQGYARYVSAPSLKGTAELDWSDAQQRRQVLGEVVADADRLLELTRQAREPLEPDGPADQALVATAGLLSRVLLQDLDRRDDGPALQEGVAPDRLVSVHDPEQRHGRKSKRKRFDGHKVALAVDTESQLITAVEVVPGNAPDAQRALGLVEQTEAATGCTVAEVLRHRRIGDCAYGAGATRQAFADAGRKLVAKVPTTTNQGQYPKTAFAIDLEMLSCTCPAGQTTTDLQPRAAGGGEFRFAAAVCEGCPERVRCKRGGGGRTVHLHPQERLLQAARTLQASPAFPEYRTERQTVEHRIARLMQLGLRQARYMGLAKTLFQACLAAAVANLTLLAIAELADTALLLAGALVLLAWLLLALAERPGALCWDARRAGRPNLTFHLHIGRPPPSLRRLASLAAPRFQMAGCRPGF
jgi:transposase